MKNTEFVVKGKQVSKSNAYRIAGKRMYKTKQCKDWEAAITAAASKAHGSKPVWEGEVRVVIALYFADARRRDCDGPIKSLLDAMNKLCYKDDTQVSTILIQKKIDREDPRSEVSIIFID